MQSRAFADLFASRGWRPGYQIGVCANMRGPAVRTHPAYGRRYTNNIVTVASSAVKKLQLVGLAEFSVPFNTQKEKKFYE